MEKNDMKIRVLVLLILGLSPVAWAQEAPKVEVFGGYSYLNFDVTNLTAGILNDRLSAHGWEASASFSVNNWFGVEGDFSGHYRTTCEGVSGLTCKDLSFMGGPRFTYRKDRYTAFAHGLFGGDNGSGSLEGFSLSDTPFALAVGGGVDYAVSPRIAIRFAQFDYFMTRHALNLGASTQNNFRVSAGVVFRFGGGTWSTSGSPRRPNPANPEASAPTTEAILLGVTGSEHEDGVHVASVRSGSPAAKAGIQPGDTIATIDGQHVRNSHDIEAAIATNTTGTIKVGLLIKGAWLSEREVKMR
jgi:opacity protein-like surface antigen